MFTQSLKGLSLLNDKAEWISNQSNPFNFQNLETFAMIEIGPNSLNA